MIRKTLNNTHGPWFRKGLTVHAKVDNCPQFVLYNPGTPVWVAQMICGNPSDEDYDNARLIEAAPDLLDLLIDILNDNKNEDILKKAREYISQFVEEVDYA